MNRNIVELIGDAVNKIAESAKPKKYVVYEYAQNSPVYGNLYAVNSFTENELKHYIATNRGYNISIFRIDDEIKYNIDVTIEEVNNDNNK